MAQRFGTIVASALAGVLALGTMAGTAHAQDPTRDTLRVQDTTRRVRPDTSAYRSMDTRADSARADSARADSVRRAGIRDTSAVRTDTTMPADTTIRRDTTGAHFNHDSAQTAPRAGTTKGLPGTQGPPPAGGTAAPGSVSPVVPPRADTSSAMPAPTPATPTPTPPR